MSLFQAIILGIVQGLTEFLPISSTAHLRIVPALLNWEDPGTAFSAVVQIGTLAAVFVYFWHDVVRILRAMLAEALARTWWTTQDARLGWMMLLGTIPIGVCGLLWEDLIETEFRSLYVISVALIVLALVLVLAERAVVGRVHAGQSLKGLAEISWRDAIGVGLAQVLALIPGASRSGVTITGGLFLGLTRETAARFSFLMSLPAISASGIYELIKEREVLLASGSDMVNLLIATVVSGVVGYLAIAFLVSYLKRHTTYLFVGYRLALGGLLLVLIWSGVLSAYD